MNRILIVLALVLMTSCKEATKSVNEVSDIPEKAMDKKAVKAYPENVDRIFNAHGGLTAWRAKRTLSFTMPKPEASETHTIDLYTRKEKIVSSDFSMGYDEKNFWLADEKQVYKGDPIFYHNLMFYFYAMPFVLADDGINYSDTENLEYDGKSYPGIRISYNDGVGVSSKDEYFLHYDAETNQMAWLGYTVTYRSGEKSDTISWIRYNDWQNVDGLILPKSLTWYNVEDGKIMEAKITRNFNDLSLLDEVKSAAFYAMPDNAKIVTEQ